MTDMEGNPQNLEANQGPSDNLSADGTDAELLKTLNNINDRLAQLEGQQRALQSGKDRGIAGLQNEVGKIKNDFGKILEYGEKYSDPAEAERNYLIDSFLQTQVNNLANQQDNPAQAGQANQPNATAPVDPGLLQKYDVNPQSAEYLQHVANGMSSFEATLAIVASRQEAGQEGLASGVSGGAGSASPANSQERNQTMLKHQYDEEVNALAQANGGYLSPRQLYFVQEKFVNEHGLDPSVLGW